MMYLRIVGTFLAGLLMATSASAALITIQNHSFEDDGTSANGLPVNWDAYNAINGGFGTYPPEAKTATVDDFYNQNPPDGTYVGYVFGFVGAGSVGFKQTLTSSLMANSRYDLSVAVGNLQSAYSPRSNRYWNYEDFSGYEIELWAGTTLLESDSTSANPGEGEFAIASLSFTTGNSHTELGEMLEIRLINQNLDLSDIYDCTPEELQAEPFCGRWNSEVDFDDVQLSVSSVPAPAAIWLFGTGLIGLIGFTRRRKA